MMNEQLMMTTSTKNFTSSMNLNSIKESSFGLKMPTSKFKRQGKKNNSFRVNDYIRFSDSTHRY